MCAFLAERAAMSGPVPAVVMAAYFRRDAANDLTNRSWTLGWESNAAVPIDVTAPGFYDAGANGLGESHAVGIYSGAGSLIVSTHVLRGDPLSSWWRFSCITRSFRPTARSAASPPPDWRTTQGISQNL